MFNGAPFNIEEVENELKGLCVKITAGMYPQLSSVLLDSDQDRKRYKLRMIMSMCDIIDKMESKEINDSEEEYIVGMLDDAIEVNQSELKGAAPKWVDLRTIDDFSEIDKSLPYVSDDLLHDAFNNRWCYPVPPDMVVYVNDSVNMPPICDVMCEQARKFGKDLSLRTVLATIKSIIE